jgi:hypothetical protein
MRSGAMRWVLNAMIFGRAGLPNNWPEKTLPKNFLIIELKTLETERIAKTICSN